MMKLFLYAFILFGCSLCAMDIHTICTPAGKHSAAYEYALKELQTHLEKTLGHPVRCIAETDQTMPNTIYLGETHFAAGQKIDFSKFAAEEWLIRNCNDSIILGGSRIHGTLYAVYEFLERFAEIDWFDEHFTYIPRLQDLKIPSGLKLQGKPSVRYRGQYNYKGVNRNRNEDIFKMRNRENIFHEKPKPFFNALGFNPVLGLPRPYNTLYFYVAAWPKTEEFKEFYSMDVHGRRLRPKNIYGPGQICFSNKDCRKKFASQMLEYIRKDRQTYVENYPLLYNLSINDNSDICHCAGCKALTKKYRTPAGAMLEFINTVAGEIAKEYPDITIQTSAYRKFEPAPTGIKPEKNVAVRFSPYQAGSNMDTMRSINDPRNKRTFKALDAWAKKGRIQIWNYWVSYGDGEDKNVCVVNIDAIEDNLKTYYRRGADYIFSECEYPDNTTFYAFRCWFGYRLLNDMNADTARLKERFFQRYYGPAAPAMKKYYDYLVRRQPEAKRLDTPNVIGKTYVDADFFLYCDPLMHEAMEAVRESEELTQHILNEFVSYNIAKAAFNPFPKQSPAEKNAFYAKLEKDWKKVAAYYYGEQTSVYKKRCKEIEKFFSAKQEKPFGHKYPVPDEMKDKKIYEITYLQFNKLKVMARHGLKLFNDKDSPTGKCMGIMETGDPTFHKQRLTSGMQDRGMRIKFHSYEITRDKIPQDEKFHFYDFGTMELHAASLFWFHRSWLMQQELSHYYRRNEDNRYRLYVSIKFTGPSYVKGSAKKDGFFIDRFLLVRIED